MDATNQETNSTEIDHEKDTKCPVCLEEFSETKQFEVLSKCKHKFCKPCLEEAMSHKPVCPLCKVFYGKLHGNQPEGTMTVTESRFPSVSGYEGCGVITVCYEFPNGIQGPEHPNPGKKYNGTIRKAYFPNNADGKRVVGLLRKAFDARLVFTVGTSVTTGAKNNVTWNDMHHKTSMTGGPESFGYPDPTYLQRITEELDDKGFN